LGLTERDLARRIDVAHRAAFQVEEARRELLGPTNARDLVGRRRELDELTKGPRRLVVLRGHEARKKANVLLLRHGQNFLWILLGRWLIG
jgi:hypothetical protein